MIVSKKFCIKVGVLGSAVILWVVIVTQSAILLYASHPKVKPNFSAKVIANLTAIQNALYTYANENVVYPPRLSMLYPYYISDPAVFWNPGDSDPKPTTITNDEPNGINSTQVSFHYFAPSSDYPFLVLQDNSFANNGGMGVYASGSGVHFFTSDSTISFTAIARGNLELIGTALHNYADAHGGHYPDALSALYPAYISDPTVFWNPGDHFLFNDLPAPATIDNDQPDAANSAQISYAYLGAGYTTASNPGVILVQDNSPLNNGGVVLNILTSGMNVATYVPDVGCDSSSSCRALAMSNLKGIGIALYTYANENANTFPFDLSVVMEQGSIFNPTTFWNPGDIDPRPLFIDKDGLNQPNSTQISYAYFGGAAEPDFVAVVANDNTLANNVGEGLLVLTSDSSAEFFERSDRTHPTIEISKANLRQIGTALRTYANAHGGQFPVALSLLYPSYISDPKTFWNPGDHNPFPTTINNDIPNTLNSARVSYHYLGAAYNTACPAGTVLVEDNSLANNFGSGINVLTANGIGDFYVPRSPKCSPSSDCESITSSRLRMMLKALYIYANENGDMLPPALSRFYPDYIARPRDFWIPSDHNLWPLTIDNDVVNGRNSAQISFTYFGAGLNFGSLLSTYVLIRENASPGGGNQVLELRADGNLYYVKSKKH